MSTIRSKATKIKSNSQKKMRKPVQDNEIASSQCSIGIQTIEDKKGSMEQHSTRKSDVTPNCKSLENIMNLKNTSHDTISMSKTDISIVYGMYKSLIQKHNVNNGIQIENYESLLTELHKFENQLKEQNLCHKSLVNLVTHLMSRYRNDRRMRKKRGNKLNKMLIAKFNQITSLLCTLQRCIESLETKVLTLDSNMETIVATAHRENLAEKKEKSICCSCM